MDELLLPVARPHWIFQVVGSSIFLLMGVVLVFTALSGSGSPRNGWIGVACMVMFGTVLIGSVRGLLSPGLQLTSRGFTYGAHAFVWSDIAGFRPVGIFKKTHVKIQFVSDAVLPWNVRAAILAAKIGFYAPTTHLPVKGFVTGDEPLDAILTAWWERFRTA